MKSTAENLQLWEQRINERVQSGMTIEEWCKKNGVGESQYNYWNRRVRETSAAKKSGRSTGYYQTSTGVAIGRVACSFLLSHILYRPSVNLKVRIIILFPLGHRNINPFVKISPLE